MWCPQRSCKFFQWINELPTGLITRQITCKCLIYINKLKIYINKRNVENDINKKVENTIVSYCSIAKSKYMGLV